MKTRITEKQLRRFYRLLSVRMIDFDCGKLCAPKNNGIPSCCENENVVPILFREEFNWHGKNGKFWGKNGKFWKRITAKKKSIKKMIEESASYYVFSECLGPGGCRRSKRSLCCMTFPFEPHVNREGMVVGLVYTKHSTGDCPLVGKPRRIYNPLYISNSITFWQELFDLYPQEEELYIEESGKRERRAKRQGKRIRIFRHKHGDVVS
jgi:hypothetical protein